MTDIDILRALLCPPCEACKVPTSIMELDDHGICDNCAIGAMTPEELEADLRASGIDVEAAYTSLDAIVAAREGER